MKLTLTLCMMTGLCLVFSTFTLGKGYINAVYATTSCDTNGGLIPDLQTVVPQHLQIVNQQQHEVLRLTNGIGNTGDGLWQMVPVNPPDKNTPQKANQQFLDSAGNIVASCLTGSESVYHPAHKHFHISDVAKFEVHSGSPGGPVIGESGTKVTSCLIDWVRLDGNSPDNERAYNSCDSGVQGISPGWVDQYHMALEGQSIDITGAAPGKYYLVSTSNPEGFFLEQNNNNNDAWVAFQLSRASNGNPKIEIVDHSNCDGGLCGEDFPNR